MACGAGVVVVVWSFKTQRANAIIGGVVEGRSVTPGHSRKRAADATGRTLQDLNLICSARQAERVRRVRVHTKLRVASVRASRAKSARNTVRSLRSCRADAVFKDVVVITIRVSTTVVGIKSYKAIRASSTCRCITRGSCVATAGQASRSRINCVGRDRKCSGRTKHVLTCCRGRVVESTLRARLGLDAM